MHLLEEKPFEHNFSVAGNDENLPENLGNFETIDEFQEYFALNTVSEHQKTFAQRWYTDEEIHNFREMILGVVENELPEARENLAQKESDLQTAKKEKETASETVGALQTKISDFALEIKAEKTSIEVPANRTYRLPHKGRYYFYVWQDNGDVSLAAVYDIPEHEKADLFSSTDKNEKFFESLKNGKDKGKTQQIS
jgi:hypothetical protein